MTKSTNGNNSHALYWMRSKLRITHAATMPINCTPQKLPQNKLVLNQLVSIIISNLDNIYRKPP